MLEKLAKTIEDKRFFAKVSDAVQEFLDEHGWFDKWSIEEGLVSRNSDPYSVRVAKELLRIAHEHDTSQIWIPAAEVRRCSHYVDRVDKRCVFAPPDWKEHKKKIDIFIARTLRTECKWAVAVTSGKMSGSRASSFKTARALEICGFIPEDVTHLCIMTIQPDKSDVIKKELCELEEKIGVELLTPELKFPIEGYHLEEHHATDSRLGTCLLSRDPGFAGEIGGRCRVLLDVYMDKIGEDMIASCFAACLHFKYDLAIQTLAYDKALTNRKLNINRENGDPNWIDFMTAAIKCLSRKEASLPEELVETPFRSEIPAFLYTDYEDARELFEEFYGEVPTAVDEARKAMEASGDMLLFDWTDPEFDWDGAEKIVDTICEAISSKADDPSDDAGEKRKPAESYELADAALQYERMVPIIDETTLALDIDTNFLALDRIAKTYAALSGIPGLPDKLPDFEAVISETMGDPDRVAEIIGEASHEGTFAWEDDLKKACGRTRAWERVLADRGMYLRLDNADRFDENVCVALTGLADEFGLKSYFEAVEEGVPFEDIFA